MCRTVFGVVIVLATIVAAGCEESTPTSPDDAGGSVTTVTETFADTLTVNGGITHPFVVGTPGSVTATLVSLSPDDTVQIGMSLGTWNTTTQSCQIIIASDLTSIGKFVLGTAQTSGAFCVRVYDVGRLTAPSSYEISIAHQ